MTTSPCSQRGQSGQATTEFVVLALVLVPLFIAIPLIGKYIDVIQVTEASSRYLAFEAAARNTSSSWKTDAELAMEVRRRFFSNSDAPVKTGDAAGNFTANRNPMWSDHAGHPLIDDFIADVSATGNIAGLNAIGTVLYKGALGLPEDNLYTGTVGVRLASVANFAPFDTIALTPTRKTVLLTDAWTARTSGSIREKIEDAPTAYPTALMKPIIDLFGTLPPLVFDPAMKVGDFDWDIVPCDRLVGGC